MQEVLSITIKSRKLSTAYILPLLLVLFIIPMLLTIFNAYRDKKQLVDRLNIKADQLLTISAAAAEDALWSYNDVSLSKIGDELADFRDVAFINILDDNNNVIYGVSKTGIEFQGDFSYPTYIKQVVKDGIFLGELRLGFTTYYLDKEINEAVLFGFIQTIIISAILLLLIYILTRNITDSIDNIDEGVNAFVNGVRDRRIHVKDNHEIRRLADRINQMFDTIVESDQKIQENYKTLHHLAYFDRLTGLPNRAMLLEQLLQILEEDPQPRGALLFLDIDDFKTINDTKGHSVGDQLLKEIANELEVNIPHHAIARIGGDEFVIICKECDRNKAICLANLIIQRIRNTRMINGSEFVLSCSIGIALFPEDGTDVEALLMKADGAMYEAKTKGKDQYKFYEQSINDQMVRKMELQNEIRQGILNHEFILYYQPQVNLENGTIIGVEALVRWMHPQRGLIMPGDFIELAEETGLIVPLGEYILRTACEQSVVWEKAGITGITMSVNISAKQINRKNIVNEILAIIHELQMRPELLVLEITESLAMENIDHTIQVINKLKEHGITFSLDDFGTGYSSLNYLKNIPINHLKIDKHFVQSLQKQPFEEVVIKSIIKIAHAMDLTVVAEGIETIEQKDTLIEYQCDLAQGYYFSKPLPKQELETLILQGIQENRI